MATVNLSLQSSERAVLDSAAQIYAAYIKTGRVVDHSEEKWLLKSVKEAIQLAQLVESHVKDAEELA